MALVCGAACGGEPVAATAGESEAGATTASTSPGSDDGTGAAHGSTTSVDGSGSSSSEAASSSSGSSGGSGSSGSTGAVEDTSSSDGSTTGALPEGCFGIDTVALLDPVVTPIDADSWSPGGSVTVGATLSNPGPDFVDYPSIVVESDHPQVTSAAPNNSLFAILTGQAVPLSVVFIADRAVPPGTEVTFTIRMATLETVCPNGAVVEVAGTVQ